MAVLLTKVSRVGRYEVPPRTLAPQVEGRVILSLDMPASAYQNKAADIYVEVWTSDDGGLSWFMPIAFRWKGHASTSLTGHRVPPGTVIFPAREVVGKLVKFVLESKSSIEVGLEINPKAGFTSPAPPREEPHSAAYVQGIAVAHAYADYTARTFSSNTTSGNCIVACRTSADGVDFTEAEVEDDDSNGFLLADSSNDDTEAAEIHTLADITGRSGHQVEYTYTDTSYSATCAYEYSGIVTIDEQEGVCTDSGSSAAADAGDLEVAGHAALVACYGTAEAAFNGVVGSNYTERADDWDGTNGTGIYVQDRMVSSGDTYTTELTSNDDIDWVGIGISVVAEAGYNLTCAQGTYTLTGQAVGLQYARTISLEYGTFSKSCQAVGLLADRTLSLAQGTYSKSCQAVGLTADRTLSLGYGTYSKSCQALAFSTTSGSRSKGIAIRLRRLCNQVPWPWWVERQYEKER